MNIQRINITLPSDLLRDFRRIIPEGERSKFIAETIAEKLKKKKGLKKALLKSLKANREYYEKVGREIDEDFKYADAEIFDRIP